MLLAMPFTTVDSSLTRACETEQCLVADRSCSQIQALVEGAQLPVLDGTPQGHPLQWISQGLRQRRAEGDPPWVLHLIAHGRPGAFRIGDAWIDAEALKAHANELAHWGVETIALWSCYVGADAGFVALLEELSGARVLASADWLGRDGEHEQLQLGDWQLSDLVDPSAWPAQFRLEEFDDELTGSNKADQLDGGKGDDSLTGGAGQDDFELSDGDDVILDFEDDTDVISVRSYRDLSLEQDGDDVLIIRGDEQTRVLNSTVDAVADSLVRIDARLETSPLTDGQRDDLRAAFRRLLTGKAVDASAIGDELSKEQKKGLLRSLRSVMKREPLVSDDALSQFSDEQKDALITEVKRLLNGREISAGPLGSIFSNDEKEALKDYLAGMSVAAYKPTDKPGGGGVQSNEKCLLDVIAGDGYLGDRMDPKNGKIGNNNFLYKATRFAEAGVQSIHFQSNLEKSNGRSGGSDGQGNDYSDATVEIIRNDGKSVSLKGRISWQVNQPMNSSMGVHIKEEEASNSQFKELFPKFGFEANRLNIIVPMESRSVESLLKKKDSSMIQGAANPPEFEALCDFEPHPPSTSVSLVDVADVSPVAVCEASDTDADNEATYSFEVKLADGGTKKQQTFRYEFTPERNDQVYEVLEASLSNGSSTELENNALGGASRLRPERRNLRLRCGCGRSRHCATPIASAWW